MSEIKVIKRDGIPEPLDLEKMHKVVMFACEGIAGVSASEVELKSHIQFYSGMTSSEIQETLIKAAAELISEDFEKTYPDDLGNVDNRISLTFDIDNDYKTDTLSASYWWRWGRLSWWKINFGNGSTYYCEEYSSPKRIGIMKSTTNDVHDIVLECDEILKWNGETFQQLK